MIDASNGNTLLKLGPKDISRGEYLDTLDRKATETNSLGPFEGRVLLLNLSFDERPDLPPEVVHRFHISGNDPFTAQPTAFDFAPARLSSPRRASGSIAAARRRGWLASDGCCGPTGPHRSLKRLVEDENNGLFLNQTVHKDAKRGLLAQPQ